MASSFCPQTMTDVVGNPEEERRADYYYQPWSQEAVCRYFYSKVGTRSNFPTYVQVLASTARLVYRNCYSIKPLYVCMGPYLHSKVGSQTCVHRNCNAIKPLCVWMGPYFYSKVGFKGCPMKRICYFSKLFLCITWSLFLHSQLMANLTYHFEKLENCQFWYLGLDGRVLYVFENCEVKLLLD